MNPIRTSFRKAGDPLVYTIDVTTQVFELLAGDELVGGEGWVLDEGRTDDRIIYVRETS